MKVTVPRSLHTVEARAGGFIHGCPGRRASFWMLGMAIVPHFSLSQQGLKSRWYQLPTSLQRSCRFLPANLEPLKPPNLEHWYLQLDTLWEDRNKSQPTIAPFSECTAQSGLHRRAWVWGLLLGWQHCDWEDWCLSQWSQQAGNHQEQNMGLQSVLSPRLC